MATIEKPYIKLWIGNLGKYNEGELIGEWFSLPCNWSEVAEKIELNEEYEEWQINDYESNIEGLSIAHYDSVDKLNKFAEYLETLDEQQLLVLQAYVIEYGINYVMDSTDDLSLDDAFVFYSVQDMEDVAYNYYEETGMLAELEKHINPSYIDFESIGRDMHIEGNFIFLSDYDVCIQLI